MRLISVLFALLLASCSSTQPEPHPLEMAFVGNTVMGKDYATYFIDSKTAIMNWQGKTSIKEWWIENDQFCHKTEDGSVCEEVTLTGEDSYEFCGRWGCFPAQLVQGNPQKLAAP